MKRVFYGLYLFILATGLSLLLAGCATTEDPDDSELPWNMPQTWESAPSLPGLEQR